MDESGKPQGPQDAQESAAAPEPAQDGGPEPERDASDKGEPSAVPERGVPEKSAVPGAAVPTKDAPTKDVPGKDVPERVTETAPETAPEEGLETAGGAARSAPEGDPEGGTGGTGGDARGASAPDASAPGGAAPGGTTPGGGPAPGGAQRRSAVTPGSVDGAANGRRGIGGGILMGKPFGVPVYVAPSWFLVAALITWVFGGQLERVLPELGAARYLVSLFFAVAFYASVLVHELAHTVAALRFKLPVRRIQLQFFGGVSEIEKESETPGREFVLAFVGPLLSLVLAAVFYGAMYLVEPGTVPGVLVAGLMISNLIVAIFNLLPGLPLDGGRMLRAVVWAISGKPMTGTVAAAWVGRALAVAVLVGLPLLTHTGALGNERPDIGGVDSLSDALLAAILAAIIWTGAGNSLRMARLREHLPDLRARTLTRRAVPVEPSLPLSEALRRANDAGARALVVVDGHGVPTAVVRETAIVAIPEHRRPWVAVGGLAQELKEGMRVPAELAGEDLLDHLRATPATEYLVVEDTGEIYGVLSTADVEKAFVAAMARPS